MISNFRQWLGVMFLELPRYVYLQVASKVFARPLWLHFKNRGERISVNKINNGVVCHWRWTSDLYLPKKMPSVGISLLKRSLNYAPIQLDPSGRSISDCPEISFVIGHRGHERLPLLLQTLQSIGGQTNAKVECIVVEQSIEPSIQSVLPAWVKYVHQLAAPDHTYSRAQAFNLGASMAESDNLIVHDNDLLVPACYAEQHLRWIDEGYDFVNLKRFIFYLDERTTSSLTQTGDLSKLSPESIMQNAQGGGSIGAKKSAYWKIGGFDENFVGWGGEDNEFWERAATMRVWPYADLPLIHLWHSPQKEKHKPKENQNVALYETLSATPAGERIAALRQTQKIKNQ